MLCCAPNLLRSSTMASEQQLDLSPPHPPKERAIEAFEQSRHDWDKHEPKMWSLASGVSDHDLTNFTIKDDLVVVRSAQTSYGVIIFGKIRIRAIRLDDDGQLIPGEVEKDEHGKIKVEMKHGKINDDNLGFIFVSFDNYQGVENVKFHSLFTEEGKNAEGHGIGIYRAIQRTPPPWNSSMSESVNVYHECCTLLL
ncbi:hypothetical protein B0H10DRAFT_2088354 [Mycena sp. CBHHK59/15]|nr:hypothetical protein B0H10DRAFT_2088354 [Mycena sp. CBHHK59/15]